MKSWALARADGGEVHSVDVEHACGAKPASGFLWVHLDGNESEAANWLHAHADLPEAVIAALTATETRPRSEAIAAGALVNLRGLRPDHVAEGDRLVSIRLWAEARRVLSVSFRPIEGLDRLKAKMHEGMLHDPGDLIAALAVGITARLDPIVADLGDRIDDCEETLEPSRAFQMRHEIARARSEAIAYRRFVQPQQQALERLAEFEVDWLEEGDRLHLREASDRFARMAEELESVRERSALLHEQLTDLRAEQVETRSLVISIVALVFLPLTFLTGLLGMNVEGIPFAKEPWAFAAVCGLCFLIAATVSGYFIRARWFRSQ